MFPRSTKDIMSEATNVYRRRYSVVLIVLLILFVGRVAGQLVQYFWTVSFLPPFEDWHSATLPYSVLVATQFLLVALIAYLTHRVANGTLRADEVLGRLLAVLGTSYFGFMVFRLVAGLTFLSNVHWFHAPLPSAFHLVLAAIMLVFADYNLQYGKSQPASATKRIASSHSKARGAAQWASYPLIMASAMALLSVLRQNGTSLAWSPYVVVGFCGFLVILCERLLPYRRDWSPTARDLADDAFYAFGVQTVVPLALSWLTVWFLQRGVAQEHLSWKIWPAMWPIWIQLLAKIAIGDFFRYWLHRVAHNWNPIWRLHALHHQPEKLYSTNVFRFHPLEKALQFVCDSLPFILFGIGPDVLAYYFVFYAISGLFQHANADVRLGALNYFVSGPEVHRWHHSRKLTEANANYAHSFVLWDILFGTYYRPRGAEVTELGLWDRGYPQGKFAQLTAPFRPALWA